MFAKRIRDLRENNNWQQKDLASELNVLEATVSMWETGKRIPYSDMLVKIANLFDVSVDYLLGNEKVPSKKEQELKEKQALKKLLQKTGFMAGDEDLTDEELERLIEFVNANKKFITGDK